MKIRPKEVLSTLRGQTTSVPGRFIISGPTYQFVADSSVRTGGPGQAPGSLDLLVASLVVCAVNVLRSSESVSGKNREVDCYARVERDQSSDAMGEVILEFLVEGIEAEEATRLIAEYKARCRVYSLLKDSLTIHFFVHDFDSELGTV